MVVFFLMEGSFYYWTKDMESVTFISHTLSPMFDVIDDENFYIGRKHRHDNIEMWQYMKITVLFKLITFDPVYQINQDYEETISFGFDQSRTVLILLYTHKDEKKNKPKYVRIVDIKTNGDFKIMYDSKVTDKELIGRLTSMLYCFIDGHIYYNRSVIKIRYDLLECCSNTREVGREYTEYEIFDYFNKILVLDENDLQTI